MFSKDFCKKLAERAISTGAQAVATAFFFSDAGAINAFDLDPKLVAGFFIGGVVAAIVKGLASAPFGPEDDPGLV